MNFKIISLPCPTTGGSPLLKCQRLTFTGDLANYYWCGLVEILDGTTVITSLPISSAGSYSLTFHATSTSTTIRFTQNATITPWFFLDNILLVKTSNDAIVESYADYYPFGEQLPGRNFTSSLLYKYVLSFTRLFLVFLFNIIQK